MVLAFSLQSDIKSIGAYAGFAAIIGLALLVLLYFAQARELRRMSNWLEDQEDRLRAAPARSPMPRPVAATPARPQTPPTPVSGAGEGAANATVVVPGVRRVAVGAAGGVATAVEGADQAAGAGGVPSASPDSAGAGAAAGGAVEGAVPAATVAGAMAAASGDPSPDPDSGVGAPATTSAPVADDAGAAGWIASPSPEPGGEADATRAAAFPATPGSAVPLSARPPASAEPVGAGTIFDGPGAPATDSPAPPDTAETSVVAPFEPDLGAPPFDHAASPEISAERIQASPFRADPQPGEPPSAAGDPKGVAVAEPDDAEPPPLAPSTAAGARPRFPPAPDARAAPVGVTARIGAGALGASGLGGGGADGSSALASRRRERERDRDARGDDGDFAPRVGGASTLRLVAAALVIVAVLVFIATKVLGSSTPTPPSKTSGNPTSSVTGPSPATITVAVLNGTHTSGLATRVSGTLAAVGFQKGAVRNALSQRHTTTLVSYTTVANRAAALEVAKDLAPAPTRVGPVDAATASLLAAAGGAPGVVVTVGSSYASG